MSKDFFFPKNFFWGAATSAYQVEGNNHNDWSEWERERGLKPAGQASDHYNRFEEDFDIAKSLGHNAHRFSIEWSRIEPEEGKFNEKEIEHYRKVINALRAQNIEPFITLWHWATPLWFYEKGDWLWPKSPFYFARFASRMAKEFPQVTFWITLNEPNVHTGHGYLRGDRPPGERSLIKYIRANRNLSAAHRSSYAAIKGVNGNAQIGIAQHLIWFTRWYNKPRDFFFNRWFLHSIHNYQDFVGVNYYFSDRNLENKSDTNWSIDPEGLYHLLLRMARYQKPIYILENGIANAADEKRARFIQDHVRFMKKAMKDGVDVRGYFYWSLMDNFEWNDGFWPRFGLVKIDYKTLGREIRPSAWEYKKLIEDNQF